MHTHSVGLQFLFAAIRHLFRSMIVIRLFDCIVVALKEWAAQCFSLLYCNKVADSEPKKFIN